MLVDVQALLKRCSNHSQVTLGCWVSNPAQPPVLGTPLALLASMQHLNCQLFP